MRRKRRKTGKRRRPSSSRRSKECSSSSKGLIGSTLHHPLPSCPSSRAPLPVCLFIRLCDSLPNGAAQTGCCGAAQRKNAGPQRKARREVLKEWRKAPGAPGRAQQASVWTVELERAGVALVGAGQSVQVSLLVAARGARVERVADGTRSGGKGRLWSLPGGKEERQLIGVV
jgi:hypothetical protein